MHELGHVLGHDHSAAGIMDESLPLGTRRVWGDVSLLDDTADFGRALDGLGYDAGDPDSRWALPQLPTDVIFDFGGVQRMCQSRFSFYKFDEGRTYEYSL